MKEQGSKTVSTTDCQLNKTKIVKIGKEKKQFPCCYV